MTIKQVFALTLALLSTFMAAHAQGQNPSKSKVKADSSRVLELYRAVYDLKAKQDSIVDLLANIGNDTINSDSLRVFAIKHLAHTDNAHATYMLLENISTEFPLDSYDEYLSVMQNPQYLAVLMHNKNPWLFLSVVLDYLKSNTVAEQDILYITGLLQRFLGMDTTKFVVGNLIKQASGTYKENLRNILSKF